jgi:hypothetical protein
MTAGEPIRPFTMLPGAGPACEGDDCLPDLETQQEFSSSSAS